MKDKMKILIVILAVAIVAIIVNIFAAFNGLHRQIGSLYNQINEVQSNMINLRTEMEDLSVNLKEEIKLQNSILSSYDITYSNADSKVLTGDITIKVVPKKYSEGTSASITLGDKVMPMKREDSTFTAVITAPIDIIYSEFIVTFKDGDEIRSEVVANEDIGFENVLVNDTYVNFFGEMSAGIGNDHGYHGQVQAYVPEDGKAFLEVKLYVIKNDEVIWETKDFYYNKEERNYTVDINETFSLNKGDRMHLAIEIKDSYGFIYKTPIYSTEINSNDGVTGASKDMETRLYDGNGNPVEFKTYK